MIAPDMATMLSFIFTTQACRQRAAEASAQAWAIVQFHHGDSDTSTSDTLMLFATAGRQAPRHCKASDKN